VGHYIRQSTRSYKGRTYTNYVLVESVQTQKGPRQKSVCSLDDLRAVAMAIWTMSCAAVVTLMADRLINNLLMSLLLHASPALGIQ
jgi:hypothetical protein